MVISPQISMSVPPRHVLLEAPVSMVSGSTNVSAHLVVQGGNVRKWWVRSPPHSPASSTEGSTQIKPLGNMSAIPVLVQMVPSNAVK